MPMEPGGRANKLGNEFERLWAVRHLIELIAGTATTFQIEALGDDEQGTEFWVGRPSGIREAHQCKRENGSAAKWSVADLIAKGIITNARFQLDRDQSHHFIFASGDKVVQLSDLCERTQRCDNATEFSTYLTTTSDGLKKDFNRLCDHLEVEPESLEGAVKVFDYLRRFRSEIVDKNRQRFDLEELSARWIDGEPKDVIPALKDLLDESLGKTLRRSDVVASLPAGARPVDLAKDPTLADAVDAIRDRFDRSYRHLRIGGKSLGRKESAELTALLSADDGPRLVLLHGSGGGGKSGVVFEVVEQLRDRDIPCLPLRLDRDRPEDSPRKFGKALGLPASPAHCLSSVAGEGIGILVLDQVDAIRWTASHSAHAWDTCERMVSEAMNRRNVRVLVVCRSFDLEDDPRIKFWEKESKATRFKLEPLDDETVDSVIALYGVAPASLSTQQRKILRSPQGLYLWSILHEGNTRPPAFRTMTDLMRSFWNGIYEKMAGFKAIQCKEVLDALVTFMDHRGMLSAARRVVHQWPTEVRALLSLNVLVDGPGGRLLFSHQSSLDYLTALRVLDQVDAGEGTVLKWLVANDQSLFRRGQLRQILTLLRDDDPEQFLASMNDLLLKREVRFHLQHLAVQMLGQCETPMDEEVELVLGLLDRPDWADHIFSQVLAGREAWFDALHQRNILRRWLECPDEPKVILAVSIIGRVVETRGAAVEALLLDHGREKWPGRLVSAVWRTSAVKLTDGLFEAVLGLKSWGDWNVHDFVDWKSLAQASPTRCLRMLEVKIGRDLDTLEATAADEEAERQNREDNSTLTELASLIDAASIVPEEAWDRLVPYYLRVSKLLSRRRSQSSLAGWGYYAGRLARRIKRVLRKTLTAAGRTMARQTPQAFWERAEAPSHRTKLIQCLVDRCMSHGPDAWADDAIRRFLLAPSRFRSGRDKRGSAYRASWKTLRRYSRVCSDGVFAELQVTVLAHWPKEEREAYRFYHDRNRDEAFWGTVKFDVLKCNDLGLGQYILLSAMSRSRLSPDARDQLGVFRRKFGEAKPLLIRRQRIAGGWVGSTVPGDRLPKISDGNWLGIIRRNWSNRSRSPKQMNPHSLGEVNVETFACDLNRIASIQQARFARLALRMPSDCDPRYAVAILRALADPAPADETAIGLPGDRATIAEIEAVIHRFAFLDNDRGFAMAVCRAIEKRPDAEWGEDTIQLLARIATRHPDPEPGRYAISRRRDANQDDDGEEIAMFSINCVRGSAAGTIEAILFGDPGRLGMLQPAIDSLLNEVHPAVRAAAVGLALPVYNIDRQVAVDMFLKACSHPEDGVLRAYDLNHFLRYTIVEFEGRLRPLIERMVASRIGEAAKTGAAWAALAWARGGFMAEIVGNCTRGNRWHRMGLAQVLSTTVANGQSRPEVLERLRSLFNDSEKEVRHASAEFLRVEGFSDQSHAVSLVEDFLQSHASNENTYMLLHRLEGLASSLKPYSKVICSLADRFAGPLAAEARDYRTSRPIDAGLLAKLLLRLYEQSEHDQDLRRKCLDAWDGLLRQGIGQDILQNIDE